MTEAGHVGTQTSRGSKGRHKTYGFAYLRKKFNLSQAEAKQLFATAERSRENLIAAALALKSGSLASK